MKCGKRRQCIVIEGNKALKSIPVGLLIRVKIEGMKTVMRPRRCASPSISEENLRFQNQAALKNEMDTLFSSGIRNVSISFPSANNFWSSAGPKSRPFRRISIKNRTAVKLAKHFYGSTCSSDDLEFELGK